MRLAVADWLEFVFENIIRSKTNDDDTGHLIIRETGQPLSELDYARSLTLSTHYR